MFDSNLVEWISNQLDTNVFGDCEVCELERLCYEGGVLVGYITLEDPFGEPMPESNGTRICFDADTGYWLEG